MTAIKGATAKGREITHPRRPHQNCQHRRPNSTSQRTHNRIVLSTHHTSVPQSSSRSKNQIPSNLLLSIAVLHSCVIVPRWSLAKSTLPHAASGVTDKNVTQLLDKPTDCSAPAHNHIDLAVFRNTQYPRTRGVSPFVRSRDSHGALKSPEAPRILRRPYPQQRQQDHFQSEPIRHGRNHSWLPPIS